MFERKGLLTGILALLGAGIILFYISCEDSCRYLKGSLWGIDLKYLGLFFLAVVLLLSFLKKDTLCLILLSFGLGGEIFLVGYQAINATYCPFCLAFGAVLIIMCFVNFDRTKIAPSAIGIVAGFFFFFFSFTGSLTPAYGEENLVTSFGSGPTNVRLYTDYLCRPCKAAEPEVEALLAALVNKNAICLTFIDTPVHKETIFYAKYFLYALQSDRSFLRALAIRSALFEAAEQKIVAPPAMESFLTKKGIKFKPIDDVTPIFKALESFIKEDGINATPSCIISSIKGKEHLVGGPGIIKALKSILEANKDRTEPETIKKTEGQK
ncbi:MAG TPA: thioredoxin domain-containing protein [Syntrophales bacterium]|nr:thioredoxin domain-containing protein [Syntrophales bacterium]